MTSRDVLSFIDQARTQVQVTDQVLEVVSVGPRLVENVRLGERARMAALGWRFFQDSMHTPQAPLIVPSGVRTQLPVDGRGMLMQAYGVDSRRWLDPNTARLYPDKIGDVFLYRLNISVSPSVNNRGYLIDFDIGTQNRVFNRRLHLTTGAGTAVPESFDCVHGASPAGMRNGGAFYITPDTDIEVSGISILAVKTFSVFE